MSTPMSFEEGHRFGRLVVLKIHPIGTDQERWIDVVCDCGKRTTVRSKNLVSGQTTSCGCYRLERLREEVRTHGESTPATAEYEAWKDMLSRCYKPSCHSYPFFGGKGIEVCAEWREDYEAFLASVGRRPSPEHQLSRYSPRKNFTPSNTYWATRFEADRHRSNNREFTINGVTKCLEDWAESYDIPKTTLHYRLSKGMTMRDALDLGRGRRGKVLP